MTGFTFTDFFFSDSGVVNLAAYQSALWQIWQSDPLAGGSPYLTGTAVASVSFLVDSENAYQLSVAGLDLDLAAGTYWLGTMNYFSSYTHYSGRANSSATQLMGIKQSNLSGGYPFDLTDYNLAFTILDGSAVPEPGTVVLLGLGLAALSG